MLKRVIGDYHFVADSSTGMTMRWGKSLQDNPSFAPIPELADISISNHCTKGCPFCYRNSKRNCDFMTLEEYCFVLDAMNHPQYGNVFQVALGGGEPLEHPDLIAILDETLKRGIIPNLTTNGLHLTPQYCKLIKGKIGAIALSITSVEEIDKDKIEMLVEEGIKTNLHYVLSSQNIEEAISILKGEKNDYFSNINAIIFLTYKPAGRADEKHVIKKGNLLNTFCRLMDCKEIERPRIGFDACFVPMLLHWTKIATEWVDSCEGGFFSVYIDHHMNVSPCSFSGGKDSYNLKEYDFYDIWLKKFESYRRKHHNTCQNNCPSHDLCHGCCPYYPIITTCYVNEH